MSVFVSFDVGCHIPPSGDVDRHIYPPCHCKCQVTVYSATQWLPLIGLTPRCAAPAACSHGRLVI